MPGRQNIIDNVEHYSAYELLDFIRSGVITFDELCRETEGYFPADIRKQLEMLIADGGLEDAPAATGVGQSPAPAAPDLFSQFPPVPGAGAAGGSFYGSGPEMPPAERRSGAYPEWEAVDKSDDGALRRFIETHPGHPKIPEANALRNRLYVSARNTRDMKSLKREIDTIMLQRGVIDKDRKIFENIRSYLAGGFISIGQLLQMIGRDFNFLDASVLRLCIDQGFFTYFDLINFGVPQEFIDELIRGGEKRDFLSPPKVERINKECTELYFWGIPSSGKTCALGAILSVAGNGRIAESMSQDNDCQGYGYMTRLAGIFREDGRVATLPGGTPVYDVYEMGFDLTDREGKVHPLTCIDVAGETVRCMYKHDAREPLTEDELSTLETVTGLLVGNRSTNRKMHFFVLEYGAEDRRYEGLGQGDYLRAALEYIKRTRIFDSDTDGVFLLVTKVDKAGLRGPALEAHLNEYLERHYSGFCKGLENICIDRGIGNGRVESVPFTIGNVCFQNYCLFDGESAGVVVRKILELSRGSKKGRFQKFLGR